jgi:hypothetical protein
MGMILDPEHNLTIYDVPKGGGTTVRSWFEYSRKGRLNIQKYNGYETQSTSSYRYMEGKYDIAWFKPKKGKKIAIIRDPLKRFVSCYKDKIIREAKGNRTQGWTIDKILDDFPNVFDRHPRFHTGTKIRYLKYHFVPMVDHLGRDPSYYDQVFWLSDMDGKIKEYLEDTWKVKLPPLHLRDQSKSKELVLTNRQKQKIRDIYKEDYNIWCKYG